MLCRLCVNESSNLSDIFKHDELKNDIISLISSYFTFRVSQNDKNSTKVCQCCLNKLQDFKNFCDFVENAQEKWKTIQQNIKPNENSNSSEVFELEIEPYSEVADAEEGTETELQIDTIETYLNENDTTDPVKCDEADDKTNCIKNDSVSPNNESDKKWLKSKVGQFDSLIAANSNLMCHECNKPMESFKELKKHFKLIHEKTGFMICCKRKFFRAADLADHINLHLNPDYFKCAQCDKCFSSRYSLEFHLKTYHVEEEGKIFFKCKHCSRKFLSLGIRDNHEKVHDLNKTDDENLVCLKCGKSYPNKAKLKAHDFNVHKMVYSRMCHLCGKAVRGNKALERHQLLHSGIKTKVKCNICGVELSTKGILKAHMIALHPEDSNVTYECNVCGKSSPSQRALKNHMDYVHNCERSHKCTFCDKSFKKIQALKEHLTTHTGDRLYKCPHCPKTFKVRANMHHHRKLKHPKEFEENRGKPIKGR